MADNHTVDLELMIEGDETLATQTLETFSVEVTRPKPTRFVAEATAIIGVSAAAVQLVTALVDLAKKLRNSPQAPRVIVGNLMGLQLDLSEADEETIALFVDSSSDESQGG